jgi:hypothetical protein
MPWFTREKRDTPAACSMTNRPLDPSRAIGPGVGDHVSPERSSRMNKASPVGSVTGSFANGVRRFSRLLTYHVCEAPELDTVVPK